MPADQLQKGAAFRALHEGEPFVIPNPWDAGSARVLEALGFEALATTSSRLRLHARPARRRRDARRGGRARAARSTRATDLPVSVDLENGYGAGAGGRGARDRRGRGGGRGRRLDRGLRPGGGHLRPRRTRSSGSRPPSRRRASSASRSRSPPGPRTTSAATPTSTTRSRGCRPTRRAGADVLYAPGLRDAPSEIRAVCDAVGQPVNVLARAGPLGAPRSPTRARSGSASAARSPGSRSRRSRTRRERDPRRRRLLRARRPRAALGLAGVAPLAISPTPPAPRRTAPPAARETLAMSAEITEDALALRPLKEITLGERVIDTDLIPWVPYDRTRASA